MLPWYMRAVSMTETYTLVEQMLVTIMKAIVRRCGLRLEADEAHTGKILVNTRIFLYLWCCVFYILLYNENVCAYGSDAEADT